MEKTKEQIIQGINRFADHNHLHIHPGQDPDRWSDLVMAKGGCPCVPGRNSCPCANALSDIQEIGRCRCGLFCTDGYLEQYNSLRNKAKPKRADHAAAASPLVFPVMDGDARGEFRKKCVINGFTIEENGNGITLFLRGAEDTASISIEEDGDHGLKVVGATGKFSTFGRGTKRKYFEDNINRWLIESVQKRP